MDAASRLLDTDDAERGPKPSAPGAPNAARRPWLGALAFGAAALVGVALAWGFTVDDALISARVAHHRANGLGYRFNPTGPSVDCVTPLGWAELLAPLARGSAWQALERASLLGAALWITGAAQLGRACAALCSGLRLGVLALVLASCLPLGAWASSGMESGVILLLAVFAQTTSGAAAAACAGVAAAWRPELAPWAATLAFGRALACRSPIPARAAALGLALAPALLVALARNALFGHPAPLAVFAKPSDLEHGLRYTLGGALLSGPPYLLVARRSLRTLPREHWAILAALAVHALVLVGVGGDWMPFWRLAMPVMPGVLLVGAGLLGRARAPLALARCIPVFACAALLHAAEGRATRAVRAERQRMSRELAPLLEGARRVATMDVGWVGAAGAWDVVDLAGVTDPEVAYLPGGHTSKRLPPDFLERRAVDALVLLAQRTPAAEPAYARRVERRLLRLRGSASFEPVGQIRLDARQHYVVLRRAARDAAP